MKILLMIFTLTSIQNVFSLEINEKMTARLLSVSDTKKTVLLNRGIEDGLVVGDHGKLYTTSGVVGRAEVVKVSPTRSIWAIYRIVNGEKVVVGNVLSLKISEPLKTTTDPTKQTRQYVRRANNVTNDQFSNYERSERLSMPLNGEEKNDLRQMEGPVFDLSTTEVEGIPVVSNSHSGHFPQKDMEIWGLFHLSTLNSTNDLGEEGSNSGSVGSLSFSLGYEKYFFRKSGWMRNVSVAGFVHKETQNSLSAEGTEIQLDILEYGVQGNYHFLAHPFSYGKLIGYFTLSAGVGRTTDFNNSGDLSSTDSESATINGVSSFYSFGIAGKYYISHGFGARLILDYYRRSEQYSIDEETDYTKIVTGPRVQVGLGYRF